MKRLLAASLALVLLLSGCAAPELSREFDEDTVLARANSVVACLHARDYDGVSALVRADLQEALSPAVLKDALDAQLSSLGAFQSVKNQTVYGADSKEDPSVHYAIAVLVCTYASGTAVYTLSFDTDLAVVGLYMK